MALGDPLPTVNVNAFYAYQDFLMGQEGDFAKLIHHGLIERRELDPDDDTRSSGRYRITWEGRAFVEGRLDIRERIILYHGDFLGFDGGFVFIHDIDKGFSYRDLMQTELPAWAG
jgi:hypothetical protein